MYIIDIDIILKTHNFPLSTNYNIHIQYTSTLINNDSKAKFKYSGSLQKIENQSFIIWNMIIL